MAEGMDGDISLEFKQEASELYPSLGVVAERLPRSPG